MSTFAPLYSPSVTKMVDQMAQTFNSLPHLPKGLINFLAKIAPYMAVLSGVIGILSGLSMISTAVNPGPISSMVRELANISPIYYWISAALQIISSVIILAAFKPLKSRAYEGWLHMFWADVISVVQSLVGIVLAGVSPVGSVIGIVIMFYVLFEMRKAYMGTKAA